MVINCHNYAIFWMPLINHSLAELTNYVSRSADAIVPSLSPTSPLSLILHLKLQHNFFLVAQLVRDVYLFL
jgi:hypothetical protein